MMTQDEIISMAMEAGFEFKTKGLTAEEIVDDIRKVERFAALVAAHERETTGKVSLKYMNQQVLAEREACAKVCDEHGFFGEAPAAAIRARGEK